MTNASQADNLQQTMHHIGLHAKEASCVLANATGKQKSAALLAAAEALDVDRAEILAANELDLQNAAKKQLPDSMVDRLRLNGDRVEGMISGIKLIASLNDPVGRILSEWDRPNGLNIQKVSTPLGVIGVIYESRPNVTADAGALCLMSGNAVILRGGSDSFHSSTAIAGAMQTGIASSGLPESVIQLVPSVDRDAVGMMLVGLDGCIDVLVPRGGKNLVERVQSESRVPVFAHLEGICHVFIDRQADLKMASDVVLNSKMRRTGICGAMETLLIDRHWPRDRVAAVLNKLIEAGCEIRGDETICDIEPRATTVNESDWIKEYLSATVSVKIVDGVEEAIKHINHFGSHHTEAIVTSDSNTADRFLTAIDSAILLHNASTQFADGGEFGMGAEIGIATGKMHARGPIGVEQLTSFNYRVRGTGQTRP